MSKRHNWTTETRDDGRCIDCGMRRLRVEVRKRCGYYGRRLVDATIYRYRNGQEAWSPNRRNKVPGPCRPPNVPNPPGVELVCSNCYAAPFPYQREGEPCDRCGKYGARIGRVDP